MKMSEIFVSETPDTEKLSAIAEIVATAKEAYGNADAEITEPEVVSVNGLTALSMISEAGKVELAKAEVERIKINAYEDSQNEGVVFNRRVEEYLAISPVLSHITATVDSTYL